MTRPQRQSPAAGSQPLRQLPIRVKLRSGEHPEAFIRRLATANHLRPSYLRYYLTNPPRLLGSVDPGRLACLAGRSVDDLLHVMPNLRSARTRTAPNAGPRRTHSPGQDPVDMTTRLQLAAYVDPIVLRLSREFAVPRRTIIKALTGQPPARGDRTGRHSPKLHSIAGRLDELIAADPDALATSICRRIRQEAQVNASDGLIYNYINQARARPGDTKSIKHLVSRPDLFAAIRDHAGNHDLVAALANQFSTDHNTVRRVLASDDPSSMSSLPKTRKTRKTLHNPTLEPVRDDIAAMITADPTIPATAIWERVVDDHHIDVSYATVRDYIAREHHRPGQRIRRRETAGS